MLIIDWIRHTSLQVTPDLCYGQTDIQVSDTFSQEAEEVRAIINSHKYDAVFTSPLSRAEMLCHYCGYEDNAVQEPRVMERNFGDWELKTWAEVEELVQTHPDRDSYVDHLGQIVPPGGETVEDLLHRVYAFIEDLRMERYLRVAVFCHGGVINSARYFQGEIELDQLFIDVPPYGSITTLKYALLDSRKAQ